MEACDGECAQFVICDQDLSKTHIRESCIAHTRLLGVTFVRTYKSIISKMLEMFSMTNISVREASVSVRVTRQACEKKKEKILNFLLLYQEIFSQSRYL